MSTPAAEARDVPAPLLLTQCDDVVSSDTYAALSTTALAAGDPRVGALDQNWIGINPAFALQHLQATQCFWQNDVPREDESGANDAFSSLAIVALPNADAAWKTYTDLYELSAPEPPACNGEASVNARCWWTGLIAGSVWVDIVFTGMKNAGSDAANAANFAPLVTEVVTNLEAAERGDVWEKPTGVLTISRDCPSVLKADTIASTTGADPKEVTFFRGRSAGTNLFLEAAIAAGSDACTWGTAQVENGLPVQVLEGGAWAWEAARESYPSARDAREVTLTDLRDEESVWLRTGSRVPTIDLIVDGSWISLLLYPEAATTLGVDAEETLTKLAQGIVDDLRP